MRAAIEARVMVTDRLRPLRVQGRVEHQVGLPYHWGSRGIATGDSANDLLGLVARPQRPHRRVQGGDLRRAPGRRPRGAELIALVEDYRQGPRWQLR